MNDKPIDCVTSNHLSYPDDNSNTQTALQLYLDLKDKILELHNTQVRNEHSKVIRDAEDTLEERLERSKKSSSWVEYKNSEILSTIVNFECNSCEKTGTPLYRLKGTFLL